MKGTFHCIFQQVIMHCSKTHSLKIKVYILQPVRSIIAISPISLIFHLFPFSWPFQSKMNCAYNSVMSPRVKTLKTFRNACRVGLLFLPMLRGMGYLRSPNKKHTPFCENSSSKFVLDQQDYLATCFSRMTRVSLNVQTLALHV